MAGPDMASTMLRCAGFECITFERYDCDICIGSDMDDAIEFAMALGPAAEIIRLAGEAGAKRKPQAVAALKEVLAPFARPDGIWAPSSTWFITTTNPSLLRQTYSSTSTNHVKRSSTTTCRALSRRRPMHCLDNCPAANLQRTKRDNGSMRNWTAFSPTPNHSSRK